MVPPTPCPHCGRPAPIVYRGPEASCTACGKFRPPFTSPSVNLTGRPSMVGGSVARVVGAIVLGAGFLLALVVGGLFQALFPASVFGWIVGFVILTLAHLVGLPLFFGGKKLARRGEDALRATREKAVIELAHARGRILSADDVAAALAMPVKDADALLTGMAKDKPDLVSLEINEQGAIVFHVKERGAPEERVRFRDEPLSADEQLADWDERAKSAARTRVN